MDDTLSSLAKTCHKLLSTFPGPIGRNKVAALLSSILANPKKVDVLIPSSTGERELLYEDPDLGFCILAHSYHEPKMSPPHDHGPSWAIYGQARGETEMCDYELISPASATKPGKVKKIRTYKLMPGDTYVYNEGDLHSPQRTASTSLLRIEGMDMGKVERFRYEVE